MPTTDRPVRRVLLPAPAGRRRLRPLEPSPGQRWEPWRIRANRGKQACEQPGGDARRRARRGDRQERRRAADHQAALVLHVTVSVRELVRPEPAVHRPWAARGRALGGALCRPFSRTRSAPAAQGVGGPRAGGAAGLAVLHDLRGAAGACRARRMSGGRFLIVFATTNTLAVAAPASPCWLSGPCSSCATVAPARRTAGRPEADDRCPRLIMAA